MLLPGEISGEFSNEEYGKVYITFKNEKNSVDQQSVKKNSLLISLNSQLKTQNSFLTAYIKANNTAKQEEVAKEIASLEAQIASTTLAIQDLEEQKKTSENPKSF